MKQIRKRLTYANVMSSIAVFLVVGGATAFAALGKNTVGAKQLKTNAVTTTKIKNGAVTGSKVNLGTLGTVPSAASANTAITAISAKTATTADTLGGAPASAFAKSQLEALHIIGAAGQPIFKNGCERYSSFFQAPAFYKDPFGVVHLLGDFKGCTASDEMFMLPAGFRPLEAERFVVRVSDSTVGTIRVDTDGEVAVFSGTAGSLTDIQFRTN